VLLLDSDALWFWDGASWSPVSSPDLPAASANPLMAALGSQIVLFTAEQTLPDGGSETYGQTWLWDGGSWALYPGPGPSPRIPALMVSY
jgi:hypothetical protein